jgi:hypothetical protein
VVVVELLEDNDEELELVVDVVDELVVDLIEVVDEVVVVAEWLTGAVYMQEQALRILDGVACHVDAHFGTVMEGT